MGGAPSVPPSVLLWNLPTMLADVVTNLLRSETDAVIHSGRGTPAQWRERAESCGADIAVTWYQEALSQPEGGQELLWTNPRLKLLALQGDASAGLMMQLALQVEALGELSPDDLVRFVREVGEGDEHV